MKETNKKFLDRKEFLINSNITDPLLDNIFRLEFVESDETSLDYFIRYSHTDEEDFIDTKYESIWDLLIKNAHSVTTSTLETEYSPQYLGDDRRYNAFKRLDSNIVINFIESADLSIRKVFDRWLDLTLPDNKEGLYFDDTSVDLNILSIDSGMETKAKFIYEGLQPVNYADLTLDLGKEADSPKIVAVIFNFVSNRME